VLVAPFAGRWAARRGARAPATLGLGVSALALGLLALRLRRELGDLELAVLLTVAGAGLGLATAPVVAASLEAVSRTRSGLAAAGVNVARELGGVVAVAGLGALAVARLSGDLTRRLAGLGVPDARLEPVVDAVLSGSTQREVLQVAGDQVPFAALLQLRGAAESSYVGSVRLALLGAAVALLLAAVATARSLPAAAAGRD